jgi:hypothetical protein
MLPALWQRATKTEAPRIAQLIDAFSLLAPALQHEDWPRLMGMARAARSAHALARLSALARSEAERQELLEQAFVMLPTLPVDQQVPEAAQIVATCQNAGDTWRAVDLLAGLPQTNRSAFLSALQIAAPALGLIGGPALTRSIMHAIRQVGRWLP